MADPDPTARPPIWEAPRNDPRAVRLRDPAIMHMLAADKHISLLVVAQYWAWELSDRLRPKEFALSFAEFLLGGGAEDHAGAVLVFDKTQGRVFPRSGRVWGERIVQYATKYGGVPRELLWTAIKDELIGVKREAVWAYCAATGFAPPLFWPRPAPPQAPPEPTATPSLAETSSKSADSTVEELVAFLNGLRKMPEAEAYGLAFAHFKAKRVSLTDRQWREARRRMDPAKKIRRGNRK